MICAAMIVSAVSRNENPWPSENTTERGSSTPTSVSSTLNRNTPPTPRRDLALRYAMGSARAPVAPPPPAVAPVPTQPIVSQQAAALPTPIEVRSGPRSRQTEEAPADPADAAGYDPIAYIMIRIGS
jgi:hypothetical protein